MKVIIEEVANAGNSPYFVVCLVRGEEKAIKKVFSFKYGEDPVSIFNREKNYEEALKCAKTIEEFYLSGVPETKIIYENELPQKED